MGKESDKKKNNENQDGSMPSNVTAGIKQSELTILTDAMGELSRSLSILATQQELTTKNMTSHGELLKALATRVFPSGASAVESSTTLEEQGKSNAIQLEWYANQNAETSDNKRSTSMNNTSTKVNNNRGTSINNTSTNTLKDSTSNGSHGNQYITSNAGQAGGATRHARQAASVTRDTDQAGGEIIPETTEEIRNLLWRSNGRDTRSDDNIALKEQMTINHHNDYGDRNTTLDQRGGGRNCTNGKQKKTNFDVVAYTLRGYG